MFWFCTISVTKAIYRTILRLILYSKIFKFLTLLKKIRNNEKKGNPKHIIIDVLLTYCIHKITVLSPLLVYNRPRYSIKYAIDQNIPKDNKFVYTITLCHYTILHRTLIGTHR